MDHPVRAQLRHRTHQVPHLSDPRTRRDDALIGTPFEVGETSQTIGGPVGGHDVREHVGVRATAPYVVKPQRRIVEV